MKRLLFILGGLLGLIGLGLFLAIDKVDYTPYFETEYYQKGRARLDSVIEQTHLVQGRVNLGFARVNITPPIGKEIESVAFAHVPLAGYGDRKGAAATGVLDSLYVSVVAIEVESQRRLFITADLLIIPPKIADGSSKVASEKLGIERSQIWFSATHTHSGLGGLTEKFVGEAFGGPYNPDLEQWLIQQFCSAMEIALADLQPGRLGIGQFEDAIHIRNRIVGERGEEDIDFVMIRLEQDEGKTAIIGAYGGHATTLGSSNLAFSGDYPGQWRMRLEESGIDYALFFSGSVGSHSVDAASKSENRMRQIGYALADSVLRHSVHIPMKDSIELASISFPIDLPKLQVRISKSLALDPFITRRLFPPIGNVHLQAMRLDRLIWATVPADFSGELAIDLKNEMHRHGYHGLISSFNGGYVGYILPAKYYHYDQYEARTMSWFGPGLNPYVDEMLRRSMNFVASDLAE